MRNYATMKISAKKAFVFSVAAGIFAAGLTVFLQTQSLKWRGSAVEDAEPAAMAGFGSSSDLPAEPARLRIPAIGVDAAVQQVGLTASGTMGIPTNFTDVAWYKNGPRPGEPGSAVIDGHLDGRNTPRAVFYDLGKLKAGDIVEVEDANGITRRFRVVERKYYDYKASSTQEIFFGDASKTRLNLITCTGDWIKTKRTYDERVVVFTELVTDG